MQDDLDKAAGGRLRELRIAAQLSQEDVSFASEIDQSTLSKIERLGPAAVGWGRFIKVVAALGYEAEVTYHRSNSKKAEPPIAAGVQEASRRR